MRTLAIAAITAAAFGLAACGQSAEAPREPAQSALEDNAPADQSAAADAVHNATGTVKSVEGTTVTLSHGPVESLGWPAMTMGFEVPDAAMAQRAKVGDKVDFSFRQIGSGYVLTDLKPAGQ